MPLQCIFGFLNSVYGVFGYIFQFVRKNNSELICTSLPSKEFVPESLFWYLKNSWLKTKCIYLHGLRKKLIILASKVIFLNYLFTRSFKSLYPNHVAVLKIL